jgi:hypothetical protein
MTSQPLTLLLPLPTISRITFDDAFGAHNLQLSSRLSTESDAELFDGTLTD